MINSVCVENTNEGISASLASPK